MKGGTLYEKERDETEKDFGISDVAHTDLQMKNWAQVLSRSTEKNVSNRMKIEKFLILLGGYTDSTFKQFKIFPRNKKLLARSWY